MAHATWKALGWLGLIGSLTTAGAAGGWRFSNPSPHGNNLLEMGVNAGVVWQVGDRGRIYTSRDLDTWIPRESGTTKSLRGIAFFGGKTFISTEAGGILAASSQDSYALIDLGTSNWLEGIAASPNALVTVGDNGAIYSSPDGKQWTARGNFTAWLRSVSFGNGLFVAAGEDGFVATSADGQSWSKQTLNVSAHLNKVEFINDRFWIVGEAGTVLTNNSRMAFSAVNVGVTNTLFAIAGNTNEVVIAGDSALLLGDLKTGAWTGQADASSPTLAPLWPYYSVLWDGRLFLAGGRTGLKVEGYRTNSAAPIQWYNEPQPTRSWLWSATRAPDFYAACGADGSIVTSPDGIDWAREVVPAAARTQVLLGIGGNSKALLAVGTAGTILRAPNVVTNTVSTNASGQFVTNQTSLFGVIWDQVTSPTTNDLQAVAATTSEFLVGGAKGAIFTSADGIAWQPRVSGVTNFLSSAAAGPQGWVVSGAAGAILTSANGGSWTRRSSGVTTWIYAVRYGGGKLVAVGENGVILTSVDGTAWTPRSSGTTEWLNDVTFAQGSWYVAGTTGLVLTSGDAVNWTSSASSTSKSLYAAVTDGQQLVMAGLEGVILRKQLVTTNTPVNFVSIGRNGNANLFLFEGTSDARFQVEETGRLGDAWVPSEILEITTSGGTLIYEMPSDASPSRFFRTRLITQ